VVDSRNRFVPDAEGRTFLVNAANATERPEIVLLIDALNLRHRSLRAGDERRTM
jgi:hypothetical protein